jgi:hypothetical protein
MAALAVKAGEDLSLQTIIQLGAEIEAIYILASLEGRGLDLIEQHRALWKRAYEFFDATVSIWESVPTNRELLRAHSHSLKNLREIVRDRLEFYSVSDAERRALAKLD